MLISRYDQPVRPDSNIGAEWLSPGEVEYHEALASGVFVPGERRKVDAAFIRRILEVSRQPSPELVSATLHRMKGLLNCEGCALIDEHFFERLENVEWELLLLEVCGPWFSDQEPPDRGCCLACCGEYERAIKAFDEADEEDGDARVHLCRGRVLLMSGEARRAATSLGWYLAYAEGFRCASAHAWLAEAMLAKGVRGHTIVHLQAAVATLEEQPPWRPDWANVTPCPGIECWLGYGDEPGPGNWEHGRAYAWLVPDIKAVVAAVRAADAWAAGRPEQRWQVEEVKQHLLRLRQRWAL
jgi:tetratricopeptide (TPR) repeat protein